VALQSELGRQPKAEEVDLAFLLARVLYKAVLGLHYVSAAATGFLRFALECKLHNSFPSDDEIAAGVPLAEQGQW
jgi:hypothetical protein